ncbi:MAG: cytochrome c oxidase subunit 3 [Sphingobacteriales bacterium]|nr:MAG: cytochrome c oxidase subunit 3 [Sphingobacteriales bacterium]
MHAKTLKQPERIHPKKFALWLGIGTIIMMFAGLTSAFIVRRAAGNWLAFELPPLFYISTLVIALSSLTLIFAQKAFKQNNKIAYKNLIGLTLLLGILFIILQYASWMQLASYGILLRGNPSGSFVYVISGLHAAHVLGGILFLTIFFIKALPKPDPVKELLEEINTEKNLPIEMLSGYWHFVGILWVYLLVFFYFFR